MKNNKLNFHGQQLFIGIDVHLKSWVITILFQGLKLKKYVMNPDVDELVRHLRNNYPGADYRCVYEAGFSGYWLARKLSAAGIDVTLVNPADVPTKNKEKTRKTDSIDSYKLARELNNNTLEGIYIPTEKQEAIRSLCRVRYQLTKDQAKIKNRIKSFMYFLGIKLPGNAEMHHWSNRFITYLTNLEIKEAPAKIALNKYLDTLRLLRGEFAQTMKQLKKIINEDEKSRNIVKRLMTVPGIGPITAITLYTELMDINRFDRLDKLSAYVGFSPSTDSSGEKERVLGISKRHNRLLRSMMIEAAWTAVRRDPALTAKYGELLSRMEPQECIIRIAKKLLNRVMYVWKKDRDYVMSVVS